MPTLVFAKWACDQFPKKEILSDDKESFLDLESILIILIASFLIEIIAKYSQKAGDEICQSPNLVCIIDGGFFYVNLHDAMCH
jgi:hypothetical protein